MMAAFAGDVINSTPVKIGMFKGCPQQLLAVIIYWRQSSSKYFFLIFLFFYFSILPKNSVTPEHVWHVLSTARSLYSLATALDYIMSQMPTPTQRTQRHSNTSSARATNQAGSSSKRRQ